MSLAVVKCDIAALYVKPDAMAELADEALHGMVVEVLEAPAPGWVKVRTQYRYEGYTAEGCLNTDEAAARQWDAYGKMMACVPYLDVMDAPAVQAGRVVSLPKGGLVHPLGEADEDGWMKVGLPSGKQGYARQANLTGQPPHWETVPQEQLRQALATAGLSYLGTQYRWGGKTAMGIDCSGLCSMAYLLNGSTIYRDADIREGFDMHEISREKLAMGDLIFFKGHVALYLGEDQYVHSTGKKGSDGVVINSLNPASPFYREDLAKGITKCGSLF